MGEIGRGREQVSLKVQHYTYSLMYSLYCFDFAVSLYFLNLYFHLEKEACSEKVSIYSTKIY